LSIFYAMNHLNHFFIEEIQAREIEEVAVLLADAFETNPAYSLVFHKNDLREGLIWLFRANLFLLNRRQVLTRIIKERRSGKIVGTYTLLPPGGVKRTFGDYLQIGLLAFIRRFGLSTLFRMTGMDSHNKRILTDALQSKEYYYLSMVVVKEEFRGTGIGSYAINGCLNELHQLKRDCHLLGLTTQLPENVSFYSRLGFELIDEGNVHFRESHYYNYNMRYVLRKEEREYQLINTFKTPNLWKKKLFRLMRNCMLSNCIFACRAIVYHLPAQLCISDPCL